MTPTSTSPPPSGAHNKKNFTFVHCQSQILKRRQGDGQSVESYVSVRGGGGEGKGVRQSLAMGKKKIYLPVKLAQSKEKIQQQQQQQRQRRRRQRVLLLLLCRLPCTHTHSRTHARWLRAPFHWQSVDVVSVGFGRVRAVTASKINARIILPTLPLLLFLLLLWRALNPTHTLTHTHTYRNTAKNTASAAATASVDDALTRTGVPLCGCRHKTVSEA